MRALHIVRHLIDDLVRETRTRETAGSYLTVSPTKLLIRIPLFWKVASFVKTVQNFPRVVDDELPPCKGSRN